MTRTSRKNILLSTTRQWNPGDEFIRRGVESLLEQASGWAINWLIYDRNPDIRNCRLRNISNSFFDSDVPYVDLIVLAGTSEWHGTLTADLYRYSLRFSVPIMAIGIGSPGLGATLTRLEEHVLRSQACLVIVRDRATSEILSSYGIENSLMPCPSLVSSSVRCYPTQIKSVGVIWQLAGTHQPCAIGERERLVRLCNQLREAGYHVSVVVNYIEELEALYDLDYDVYYSYEAEMYYNMLKQFDALVGLRLHGCFLALSLGKPTVVVPHDERVRGGAKEVPTLNISSLDEVAEHLSSLVTSLSDWCSRHERFLTDTRREYLVRISEALTECCERGSDESAD